VSGPVDLGHSCALVFFHRRSELPVLASWFVRAVGLRFPSRASLCVGPVPSPVALSFGAVVQHTGRLCARCASLHHFVTKLMSPVLLLVSPAFLAPQLQSPLLMLPLFAQAMDLSRFWLGLTFLQKFSSCSVSYVIDSLRSAGRISQGTALSSIYSIFFVSLQSIEPPLVSDVLSVPGISPYIESRVAGTSLSLGAAPGWICTLSQASIFNPAGPALIFLVRTRSPVSCSFPAVNSLHRSVLRPLLFGCLCIWVKAASRASAALEPCSILFPDVYHGCPLLYGRQVLISY
jgi:hypothetical protein